MSSPTLTPDELLDQLDQLEADLDRIDAGETVGGMDRRQFMYRTLVAAAARIRA